MIPQQFGASALMQGGLNIGVELTEIVIGGPAFDCLRECVPAILVAAVGEETRCEKRDYRGAIKPHGRDE